MGGVLTLMVRKPNILQRSLAGVKYFLKNGVDRKLGIELTLLTTTALSKISCANS